MAHATVPHLQPVPATHIPDSLPWYLGPELRNEHMQGIKEKYLLSQTIGLGLGACATLAQILSDLVLLSYKLRQAPPLCQCPVQLCISQFVQKQ